jgi:predicted N-acetyltransferase YhbS
MKIKIRKFRESDAKRVCSIIKENNQRVASKFYSQKIIDYWNKELISEKLILKKINQRVRYVAEKNGKVVGYICFEKNVLKMLFVDPKHHGKGIGTILFKKAEEKIKKDCYKKIISKPNINAEKFHEHIGFKKKKMIYKNTGKIKVKKILMEKKLK